MIKKKALITSMITGDQGLYSFRKIAPKKWEGGKVIAASLCEPVSLPTVLAPRPSAK